MLVAWRSGTLNAPTTARVAAPPVVVPVGQNTRRVDPGWRLPFVLGPRVSNDLLPVRVSNIYHPILSASFDESGKACERPLYLSDGFFECLGSLQDFVHVPSGEYQRGFDYLASSDGSTDACDKNYDGGWFISGAYRQAPSAPVTRTFQTFDQYQSDFELWAAHGWRPRTNTTSLQIRVAPVIRPSTHPSPIPSGRRTR